jgi:hypothetical protein
MGILRVVRAYLSVPKAVVEAEAKNYRAVAVTFLALLIVFAAGALAIADNSDTVLPRFQEFANPDGRLANLNLGGPTDTTQNPFFQDMGTNGRRCVSCHQPSDAFSVTPPHLRQRFEMTDGTDPIFRPVDGATCPTADVSTQQSRRDAYGLLLSRGLIRVGIAVPANADYQVVAVNNAYGCSATDVISMYRRPLSSQLSRPLSVRPVRSELVYGEPKARRLSPVIGATVGSFSSLVRYRI